MMKLLVIFTVCAVTRQALGDDSTDVRDDLPLTDQTYKSLATEVSRHPIDQLWSRSVRSPSYQDMMSRSLRSYDDMFSRSLRSKVPYNEMMSRSLRSKALADMMSRTLRSRSLNDMMSRTLRSTYNDMLSRSLRSLPYSDMMSRSLRSVDEMEPAMKKDN